MFPVKVANKIFTALKQMSRSVGRLFGSFRSFLCLVMFSRVIIWEMAVSGRDGRTVSMPLEFIIWTEGQGGDVTWGMQTARCDQSRRRACMWHRWSVSSRGPRSKNNVYATYYDTMTHAGVPFML